MNRSTSNVVPSILLIAFAVTCLPSQAQDKPSSDSTASAGKATGNDEAQPIQGKISYALGLHIGQDLRTDGIEVDLDSFKSGLAAGYHDKQPKWSEQELQSAIKQFQAQMRRKAMEQLDKAAGKNKKQAEEFLAKNAKQDGVVQTASGLQYKVIESGDGPSPTAKDRVRTHYRGTLIDGTEFDSSYRRGQQAEFPVDAVIPGWTEALQKMHVGDKWQLYVPPELAYGANPPGPPIEPNSLLIFDIELKEILP